jgi:GNAT superfamily N-acetyltransferase
MRQCDLAAAMRLKTQAGWNQTEDEWRFFLEQRPEGCFVAEQDEQTVGTVTTIAYGPRLAWISLLLVAPAFRRQGLGTRLMQAALDSLAGWTTVALDATPSGRLVYERLGFHAEFEFVRLVRPDGFAHRPDRFKGRSVRSKTSQALSSHLSQLAALDRQAFGADRLPLLFSLHARAPGVARLALCQGQSTGFCLGRHGSRLSQLGPVVAKTVDQATALCRTALSVWRDRGVVIDVPASQDTFLAWLRDRGFEIQRPLTRMSRGARLPRPTGEVQTFAICGPEFG